MIFMKEIRRTFSNVKCVNILPSGYFKIFIFFLQKEKEKKSLQRFTWKNIKRSFHCPEGDSHMKFHSAVKATVFCIDFVVVVKELIYILLQAFWADMHFNLHKICNYPVNDQLEVISRDTQNLFGRYQRGRTHKIHMRMCWTLYFYKIQLSTSLRSTSCWDLVSFVTEGWC